MNRPDPAFHSDADLAEHFRQFSNTPTAEWFSRFLRSASSANPRHGAVPRDVLSVYQDMRGDMPEPPDSFLPPDRFAGESVDPYAPDPEAALRQADIDTAEALAEGAPPTEGAPGKMSFRPMEAELLRRATQTPARPPNMAERLRGPSGYAAGSRRGPSTDANTAMWNAPERPGRPPGPGGGTASFAALVDAIRTLFGGPAAATADPSQPTAEVLRTPRGMHTPRQTSSYGATPQRRGRTPDQHLLEPGRRADSLGL